MKDIFNIKNKKRFRELVEVDPETNCWNWKGGLTKGYARFYLPETQQLTYAHRWSWELANGPVPEGLELDHTCHNKRCCNPKHLEAVTHAVNMQRAADAGAWHGEKNPFAKRTTLEVLTIKFLSRYLCLPAKIIARVLSLPPRSVYAILSGECWKATKLPKDLGSETK